MSQRRRYELIQWTLTDEGDPDGRCLGRFASRAAGEDALREAALQRSSDCRLELWDRRKDEQLQHWGDLTDRKAAERRAAFRRAGR